MCPIGITRLDVGVIHANMIITKSFVLLVSDPECVHKFMDKHTSFASRVGAIEAFCIEGDDLRLRMLPACVAVTPTRRVK